MNKILRICCVFLFSVCLCGAAGAKLNLFARPRSIPQLSFYGDSGNKYRLDDFKSDLLIAVYWSRHCGPCLSDLKALNFFAEETKNEGIRVILISPEEEWRSTEEKYRFLKRFGAGTLVSYMDRKRNYADGMGIMVTPTSVLMDKNGQEIGQITGAVKWDNPRVINYLVSLKDKTVSQKFETRKPAYKKY